MVACVVYGCVNSRYTARNASKSDPERVTFHKFPKEHERKKMWVRKLAHDGWTCSETSRICSAHFEESSFDRTGAKVRLHKDAIPTIFPVYEDSVHNLQAFEEVVGKHEEIEEVEGKIEEVDATSEASYHSLQNGDVSYEEAPKCEEPDDEITLPPPPVQSLFKTPRDSPPRATPPSNSKDNSRKLQLCRKRMKKMQLKRGRNTKRIITIRNAINKLLNENLLIEDKMTRILTSLKVHC